MKKLRSYLFIPILALSLASCAVGNKYWAGTGKFEDQAADYWGPYGIWNEDVNNKVDGELTLYRLHSSKQFVMEIEFRRQAKPFKFEPGMIGRIFFAPTPVTLNGSGSEGRREMKVEPWGTGTAKYYYETVTYPIDRSTLQRLTVEDVEMKFRAKEDVLSGFRFGNNQRDFLKQWMAEGLK